MAPEQLRGEDATPATDICALGVVMFEMITGKLPFVGQSAFYTALKRLQEPAPSPRVHLSDLDPAWEKTILRCLERDPAERFPTVRHVVRSLRATKAEEDATSPLILTRGRSRLRSGRTLAVGVTAGLLLVAGVVGLLRFRPVADGAAAARPVTAPAPEASAVPIAVRPSVAILPFENLSDPGMDSWPRAGRPPLTTCSRAPLRSSTRASCPWCGKPRQSCGGGPEPQVDLLGYTKPREILRRKVPTAPPFWERAQKERS